MLKYLVYAQVICFLCLLGASLLTFVKGIDVKGTSRPQIRNARLSYLLHDCIDLGCFGLSFQTTDVERLVLKINRLHLQFSKWPKEQKNKIWLLKIL